MKYKQLPYAISILFLVVSATLSAQERADRRSDEPQKEFLYSIECVRKTGPDSNRIKLVYASDGYTVDDISSFPAHVDKSIEYLSTPGLATRPLPRYRNFINIYRIDLISEESGISEAPRSGQEKTVVVNNALGGTRDQDRLGWVDRRLAGQLFSKAADDLGIGGFNWPFVVLHSSGYYNSGGRYVVFSYNFGKEIGLHEAGHGFHSLADEYYGRGTYTRDEPRQVNVTADSTGSKWSHWMGYVDKDTLLGTVAVYEGAIYASEGAYRPSKNSKMGWTSDRKPASFNAICREKIIHDIYELVNPIDAFSDTTIVHTNPGSLWVKVVDPEVLVVDWYVNGELVKPDGGSTFNLSEITQAEGKFEVRAHIYDEVVIHAFSDNENPHPLDLVRRDLDKLQRNLYWTVEIK